MNGENLSNIPKPEKQEASYKEPMQQMPGFERPEMYQHAMHQTGFYQTWPSQDGMMQQAPPQTGMGVQPQMQTMMPQNGMQQRTSIMASGRGVRNSTLSNIDFTQGFLQTQIGRYVKVEFLIGVNMLIDREGILVRVGTDYIIIQESETDDYLLCDIYSIKFIRFYY